MAEGASSWEPNREKLGLRPGCQIILFTNESGGAGWPPRRHRHELYRHVMMLESDTRVFSRRASDSAGRNARDCKAIASLLAPIGANRSSRWAAGRTSSQVCEHEFQPFSRSREYFVIHHKTDTVERIDRHLAKCAAAVAVMTCVVPTCRSAWEEGGIPEVENLKSEI
jgi:hypothetical protein